MEDRAEIIFKVLVIGDSMVGKSCLIHRFAEDNFANELQPTIGVDCRPTYLNLKGKWLKLKVWDTAGQEKYRSITKSFYHGAHGAVLVYDITNKASFEGLSQWLKELSEVVGDIPVVLVGNKCDIEETENIIVNEDDAATYAKEREILQFRVSALSGINVKEAFTALCEDMMSKFTCHVVPNDKVNIRSNSIKGKSSCAC